MTIGQKIAGLGLAAMMVAPVMAQDAPPSVNTGDISFAAGADVVSSYIFRGYEQEDSGLILQPYVELSVPVADGVDLTVGQWNSLHSKKTGSVGTGSNGWYESDFYAGLGFGLTDKLDMNVSYVGYFYPSGSSGDIHELDIQVGYDDSDDLGDWSVNPYALLAIEIDDPATEDVYLELGGELSLENLVSSEDIPVSLSVPFALGLSIDDYYVDATGDDELFGFFSVGIAASMPLDMIPSEFGVWSATAGLTAFLLNDDAALDDTGEDFALVASIGVGMEY